MPRDSEQEQPARAGADEATVVVGHPGKPPGGAQVQVRGPGTAAPQSIMPTHSGSGPLSGDTTTPRSLLPAIGLGGLAGLLLFAITAALLLALR